MTLDWRVGVVDATRRGGATGDPAAQRISLEEAIRGYTINAAWLDHADGWKGSIEPGRSPTSACWPATRWRSPSRSCRATRS